MGGPADPTTAESARRGIVAKAHALEADIEIFLRDLPSKDWSTVFEEGWRFVATARNLVTALGDSDAASALAEKATDLERWLNNNEPMPGLNRKA
jgi:hypothetical protein